MMTQIESQAEGCVVQFLKDHAIASHSTVVVGLSGGADSVALLLLLVALKQPCVAAHCNFQLRGAESVRDLDFSRSFADRLGVPFQTITFETQTYAQDHKLSIEMACRELRYNWFEQLCQQLGSSYLAVAHHRDDSVETLMLNLIRGTGIAGLTGIKPVNGRIIRPLLSLSRNDIESYLAAKGVDYITDSTNHQDIYTRNKIRLNLLPQMQQINPALFEAIERTALHMTEVEKVYRHALAQQIECVVTQNGRSWSIDIERLLSQPSPSSLLYEFLKAYGFLPQQIPLILVATTAISGKQFFAPHYTLIKDRNSFILQELSLDTECTYYISEDTTQVELPILLTLEQLPNDERFALIRSKEVASVDVNKLTFPLELRKWREGDRFVPIGMRGSKKLSDYFSDHKYTLFQKESAWLLCSGEDIVWLVGERMSEKYKVTHKTTQVLQIKCKV